MSAALPVRRLQAFSLAELLLALLLLALLAFLLTGVLLGLQRTMLPPAVPCGEECLVESPSFAPMPQAVELHRVLVERLRGATAVYVFGGRGLDSGEAQETRPLSVSSLPDFQGFARGLPLSAEAFQAIYAENLGAPEATPGASDFSLLVLGPADGSLVSTCLVQCRSRQFVVAEQAGTWLRRETVLFDRDLGRLRYVFAEPCDERSPSFVGAVHSWYRRQASAGFGEEGPAYVVFPDPWLLRGTDASGLQAASESHFAYLVPLGR